MQIEDAKIRVSESKVISKRKLRSSVYTDDYVGEYYNLAPDKLIPFKKQARRSFDEEALASLASTIKQHGIRQPLTVVASETEEGKYEIVSGERRYRAALLAGKTVMPCIILHDYRKASEIAIIENIQRENLHPVELMEAYNNLLQDGLCTSMKEIADKLGVPRSSVVETLNLRKVSKKVQTLLLENKIINREFIRNLLKSPPESQERLIEIFISEHILKKARSNSVHKRLISVILKSDGNFAVDQMKIVSQLTQAQRRRLKDVLAAISRGMEV
jgi:ParB family transcriptional regulator, chromosome partitioning protein